MLALSSSFSFSHTALPRLTFTNATTMIYKGKKITMEAIGTCMQRLVKEMEEILTKDIFLGIKLSDVVPEWEELEDDPTNSQVGASIFNHPSNPFVDDEHALSRAILDKTPLGGHLIQKGEGGTLTYSVGDISRYFDAIERFKQKLYVSMHLGSGMPARGGEEVYHQYANSTTRLRNLTVFWGEECIVGQYNKTTNNTKKDKIIL